MDNPTLNDGDIHFVDHNAAHPSDVDQPDQSDVYLATIAPPPRQTAKPPLEEPAPSLPARVARWIGSAIEWLFGVVSLLVGLAVLASLPILQFLSLGYLLEAQFIRISFPFGFHIINSNLIRSD